MVRKLVGFGVATLGGLALVGTVFGTDVKIYGATGERLVREKLDAACGIPTKLEVLRTRVAELDREVVDLREKVVRQQVELEATRGRLDKGTAAIERQRKALARAAELLDEGRASYEIGGRTYPRATVESDARVKLEACRGAERALDEEKRVATIRERTLELARQHLERAETRKVELAQLVRSLDAKLEQQKAKRQLADALDTPPLSAEVQGELAKAEKLAREVEDKLAVEDRLLEERLARRDGPTGHIDYDTAKAPTEEGVSKAIRTHLEPQAETASPKSALH